MGQSINGRQLTVRSTATRVDDILKRLELVRNLGRLANQAGEAHEAIRKVSGGHPTAVGALHGDPAKCSRNLTSFNEDNNCSLLEDFLKSMLLHYWRTFFSVNLLSISPSLSLHLVIYPYIYSSIRLSIHLLTEEICLKSLNRSLFGS